MVEVVFTGALRVLIVGDWLLKCAYPWFSALVRSCLLGLLNHIGTVYKVLRDILDYVVEAGSRLDR